MKKISPFLWFNEDAEEAVKFYTSIFKNSKITNQTHYSEEVPGTKGKVMSINFKIDGEEFIALNGGPLKGITFYPAVSFLVSCKTQKDVDELWEKLGADGEKLQCGWLRDKYGTTWQIIPEVLGKMLNDKNEERIKRVTHAMLQMNKIDIAALKAAYKR